MKLRAARIIMALALLETPVAAAAQPPAKVPRVGHLSAASPSAASALALDAFRQGLRERGYIEGQNIIIEYRWAEGRLDRLPALAAELVALKVDVLVAGGTQASLAGKHATATIPIVFAVVGDPVEVGLVASLARPGGNITGFSFQGAEVTAKQLELLREAVPRTSRIAILRNPLNPGHKLTLDATEGAARALGVQLQLQAARDLGGIEAAFLAMTRERPDALLILGDIVFLVHRARLADLAVKSGLPSITGLREHAEAGTLLAYGPSLPDMYRRAATHVDKILKGAKPADLPVEQPTKFELVVNLKTAKTLGLTIPQSVLIRADQVIQ